MKRLIIAPLADDDVLGCGGILDHTCHVVYCGLDESGIDNRPEMDERISEINKVQSITNHTFEVLDNLVNRYEKLLIYAVFCTVPFELFSLYKNCPNREFYSHTTCGG